MDLWRTTYYYVMADAQAIVSWLPSTGLSPFLAALMPDEQTCFLEQYLQALQQAYPLRADGRVLLAFPRLFIVAVKKSAAS
ncbi:Trans-aconitate 2-methyltransferase|nr:Trans-aconitate 2-methyltransferase [Candidatus Pantoea persica]